MKRLLLVLTLGLPFVLSGTAVGMAALIPVCLNNDGTVNQSDLELLLSQLNAPVES